MNPRLKKSDLTLQELKSIEKYLPKFQGETFEISDSTLKWSQYMWLILLSLQYKIKLQLNKNLCVRAKVCDIKSACQKVNARVLMFLNDKTLQISNEHVEHHDALMLKRLCSQYNVNLEVQKAEKIVAPEVIEMPETNNNNNTWILGSLGCVTTIITSAMIAKTITKPRNNFFK